MLECRRLWSGRSGYYRRLRRLPGCHKPSIRSNAYGRPQPNEQARDAGAEPTAGNAETTTAQEEKADDPPEVDPSTLRTENEQGQEARDIPFRGRGRFAGAFGEDDRRGHGAHEGHERRGCGRRLGRWPQASGRCKRQCEANSMVFCSAEAQRRGSVK